MGMWIFAFRQEPNRYIHDVIWVSPFPCQQHTAIIIYAVAGKELCRNTYTCMNVITQKTLMNTYMQAMFGVLATIILSLLVIIHPISCIPSLVMKEVNSGDVVNHDVANLLIRTNFDS